MSTMSTSRATADKPPGPGRHDLGRPGPVLAVILACQLMVVLDSTIVNIALPEIRTGLELSPTNLSWVINSYTLTFGGLLLLGARAGDILGRRRTFLAGIAVFTAASLAGGLAHSAGLLLGARAVQGTGAALASPSALALLMTRFPEGGERVRAVALYTAVSLGGGALGLMAGGMLTQWASWRWVMFVNVPIGVAVLVLGRVVLAETPRHRGTFDVAGALTSTLGMASLVFGFVRAASDGWSDSATVASFAGGVGLLVGFVVVETRARSPITPLRLFASRNRVSSYLARVCQFAGMMGMFFFLTQFLQDVLHFSALRAGFAFVPLTLMLFVGAMVSSKVLIGRVNDRLIMAVGMAVCMIGLAWLTRLSESSSYRDVLGPMALFGIGGMATVPLTTISLGGVAAEDAGAASGLVNVMQQVGGSLGLAVLVTVFGSASRHATGAGTPEQQATHAFIVGADRGFWVAAAFLAGAAVLCGLVIRTPAPATGESLGEAPRAPE